MYVCIALSAVFPLASKRRKEVFGGRKLDRGVSYILLDQSLTQNDIEPLHCAVRYLRDSTLPTGPSANLLPNRFHLNTRH